MNTKDSKTHTSSNPSRPSFWRRPKFIIPCASIVAILLAVGAFAWGNSIYEANQKLDAESVLLKTDRTLAFGEKKTVTDFLEKLNGTLVEDIVIPSDRLGEIEVAFDYINIKNKRRTITFKLKVLDVTAPKIFGSSIYTVPIGYEGDLTDLILSGDDLDDHPRREVVGNYDLTRAGRYRVEYVVTDASGNQAKHPFILNVTSPTNITTPQATSDPVNLSKIIRQYKTDTTKIGIDVSQWQGEIDWEKVQAAGVEFAFIRLGYQVGFGGEYVLDPYFSDNMLAATELGLPTGVYFYSYADSVEEARAQARWIKSQISGYGVALGVAFDWENWSNFNQAGMSFRTINNVARAFLDEIDSGNHHRSEYTEGPAGYAALLYSSKNYLERIWDVPEYDTWLAQYYDRVTYDGDYRYWQLTDSGRVNGIYGDVDIDIMYLDEE